MTDQIDEDEDALAAANAADTEEDDDEDDAVSDAAGDDDDDDALVAEDDDDTDDDDGDDALEGEDASDDELTAGDADDADDEAEIEADDETPADAEAADEDGGQQDEADELDDVVDAVRLAAAAAAVTPAAGAASTPGDSAAGFWSAKYDADETKWERPGLNPAFDAWRASGSLSPPGTVIVPGCGRAPELAALAEARFRVIGVDIAENAAEWQRTAIKAAGLRADIEVADVLEWRPRRPVEAIYEQTCLCSLPPDQWEAYERQAHGWLKRGGRLFALFLQADAGGGPPYDCPLDRMQSLFAPERWSWSQPPYLPSPHPAIGHTELGVVLTRL